MDNSLVTDDMLAMILPTSYDFFNSFHDDNNVSDAIPENSELDKVAVDAVSGLPINLSEMMADFADLISLDQVLALHQNWTETPLTELPSENQQDSKKRLHDTILGEVHPFSPIPDHNYSFVNQKRQKLDESTTSESCSEVDHPPRTIVRTTKYLERRKKNNIASKRSRETRKNRFLEMEVQANELEGENDKLRDRITKLEKLTQQMKEVLVKRLTK
jgi:hypothetical protein